MFIHRWRYALRSRKPPRLLPFAERTGRLILQRLGFSSRHYPSPVGPIHVYDAPGLGSAPPFVFIHGIGASAAAFAQTMLALKKQSRRVVAIDLPGHGLSQTTRTSCTPADLYEAVRVVLAEIMHEPFVLVGNSLGGALALHFAVRQGEALAGLVLLSPAGAEMNADEWKALRTRFQVTTRKQGSQFLRDLYHRTPWYSHLVAIDLPEAFGSNLMRSILASASNETVPERYALPNLAMPVLLIWGASERILPESTYRYFRENLPETATFERPTNWGHCPHLDAPKALAQRLATFARTLPEEPRPAPTP
jgi:pimeloyl-ACP methyl ester carboxylesterase